MKRKWHTLRNYALLMYLLSFGFRFFETKDVATRLDVSERHARNIIKAWIKMGLVEKEARNLYRFTNRIADILYRKRKIICKQLMERHLMLKGTLKIPIITQIGRTAPYCRYDTIIELITEGKATLKELSPITNKILASKGFLEEADIEKIPRKDLKFFMKDEKKDVYKLVPFGFTLIVNKKWRKARKIKFRFRYQRLIL